MSGYYDCECCGTTDIGEDGDTLCDVCTHLGCGEDGDSTNCKVLILDGARGIYIPQDFAKNYDPAAWGVSKEDVGILLAGPDHEFYWDAWDNVEGRCEHKDREGVSWVLCQDGDLWAQAISVPPKTVEEGKRMS